MKYSKERERERDHSHILLNAKNGVYMFIFIIVWTTLLFFLFPSNSTPTLIFHNRIDEKAPQSQSTSNSSIDKSVCPNNIARFYIYDLPERFNLHLLRRCKSLNMYMDMCPHVSNRGLGRPIASISPSDEVRDVTDGSWYATHQFIAEMIFHGRLEGHPCRTHDPSEAGLFYAPFYVGLYASSVFRQANLERRDRLAVDFIQYLVRQRPWRRHSGGDHFLVTGRTAWDFMRSDNEKSDFGANKLFLLPEVQNMTVLTVERHPWSGQNQFGIPYPSYFHPRNSKEVSTWQDMVSEARRTHLFSFVGGPRKGLEKAAVREEILRQCAESTRCLRSRCEPGSSLCHEPGQVLGVMLRSEFCMQPPGDSFTRRSVFDSILVGCIPVFFSEHTAYTQYQWYLPVATDEYSIFIPKERWGDIEAELNKIPKERVELIRQRVIELIPSLTYAHPNSTGSGGPGFVDAVDLALARLTSHVRAKLYVVR